MPPKKDKDKMDEIEVEIEVEKPKKTVKSAMSEDPPKSKRGGLRKMTDKEKTVFNKLMGGASKSDKAKVRMKVMRSEKPVETPAKLKKLMG